MEGTCEFGIQRQKEEVGVTEFTHPHYAWLCVQQSPKGRLIDLFSIDRDIRICPATHIQVPIPAASP